MKKKSQFALLVALVAAPGVLNAGYDDARFQTEVLEGLDIYRERTSDYTPAHGEMGGEVYQAMVVSKNDDIKIHLPTDMYIRGGFGLNMGFMSDSAYIGTQDVELSGGWMTQLGLGWNLSSYVRSEIDFQTQSFGFSKHKDALATARGLGGTLYFDFARRYIHTGDVIRRRTFVPFMGLGAGVGTYKFEGANGADAMFVAPRGILGFNVMLTDVIGIDLAYQYQLFIGDGFGWDKSGGATSLSDIIVSFRVNF